MKRIKKLHVLLFLFVLGVQTIQAQEWTLQQCIDSAMVYNKKLKIESNNVLASKEKNKEVKYNLFPKVTATFDYKYFFDLPTQLMPANVFNPQAPEWQFNAAQFGVPHNINTNIQFGMPLYNPTVYGGIKTTKLAIGLKELQYQKTKEEVYISITDLYYGAQIIKNQISFMDTNIINSNKLLDNLKLLRKEKLATGTDVNKVDLQVKQLNTQKLLLESKYQQVLGALKISMGISEANVEVSSQINYKKFTEYSTGIITDVKMVEAKEELVDSEIKALKRGRIPSVMLYGSYGKTGYGYDKKPNDFLDFYDVSFVGLKIDIPLVDLTRKHKIKQKKIEKDNTSLQLDLLKEQNEIQIVTAKQQAEVSLLTIENTLKQKDIAQSIYDNTILQHKEDVASITDVLLADNNLRQAQQNYLTAVVDYLKATLELKKLTGNVLN